MDERRGKFSVILEAGMYAPGMTTEIQCPEGTAVKLWRKVRKDDLPDHEKCRLNTTVQRLKCWPNSKIGLKQRWDPGRVVARS